MHGFLVCIIMSTLNKTPLFDLHQAMGGKMVPFGNWQLPVHFGSQLVEHHAVRQDVGMFDVCHMTTVDVKGPDARKFLRHMLANDVQKLRTPGKALYSCLVRVDGAVMDDLIVYFLREDWFRLVVNASTTNKDVAWLKDSVHFHEVSIEPRFDLGMIAIQGPSARAKALPLLPESIQAAAANLKPFNALDDAGWFVSRTGYTGEDGFEVILPNEFIGAFWQKLADAGIPPCGLGARDTLRLEAGMNLFGNDMNEWVSPWSSGLSWTVDLRDKTRDFKGREALESELETGNIPRFVGLMLEGKGILRGHQPLFNGWNKVGEVTSGGFSPTLQRSIALARIDADTNDDELMVGIRNKKLPVKLVKPPFVRHGKVLIDQ